MADHDAFADADAAEPLERRDLEIGRPAHFFVGAHLKLGAAVAVAARLGDERRELMAERTSEEARIANVLLGDVQATVVFGLTDLEDARDGRQGQNEHEQDEANE